MVAVQDLKRTHALSHFALYVPSWIIVLIGYLFSVNLIKTAVLMLIRDYQLQSAMEITAQQHSEAMTQTRAMVHPGQSQVFRQVQSQARRDDGFRKQEV